MTPELADRVAKLLRMLTSSFEGERLAAANRLNAIVAAHDLDWDRVLAGSAPALSEQDMRRIWDDGYARGRTDTLQEVKPQRDWTPTEGSSSTEAGNDIQRVAAILEAAAESAAAGLLGDFEVEFCASIRGRVSDFGKRTFISAKQWAVLDKLEKKLTRQGFID